MENDQQPVHLLYKYVHGTLGPEENAALKAWAGESRENEKLVRRFSAQQDILEDLKAWDDLWGTESHERANRIRSAVYPATVGMARPGRTPSPRKAFWWFAGGAAAVLLVAMLIAVWPDTAWFGDQQADQPILSDVRPGGNKALLTLQSGETIALSQSQSGLIVGDRVSYMDGSAIEDLDGHALSAQNLILTVPRGGVYHITLPDGSNVWLNSDSRLHYPGRFAAEKREVTLEGEAFFDIATVDRITKGVSHRLPFTVHAQGQSIDVLGTSFNVSGYASEPAVYTTLVEGTLRVNAQTDYVVLSPGQQSVNDPGGLKVRTVDIQQFTAWKEGYFDFTDMHIRQVMAQLGRWYDLEIDFEGDVPDIEFFGTVNRDSELATVLTLLETSGLYYTLTGKKLTISNQK